MSGPVRVDDSNRLLDALFACQGVAIRRAPIFDRVPSAGYRSWSRIEGMMLGLAIGDALGNSTAGMRPVDRQAGFGEIRDYLPNRRAAGLPLGVPSDDTQLAFRTLQQLIEDGRYIPERVAAGLCDEVIFCIADNLDSFRHDLRVVDEPWHTPVVNSAETGALLRIAPTLIPHLRHPSSALWADAALAAMTTHNDEASIATCVVFMSMLWELLAMGRPPHPAWWAHAFVHEIRELENGRAYEIRSGRFAGCRAPLSDVVEDCLRVATPRNFSTRQACDEWGSGSDLFETMPTVLYLLGRWAHDPKEALIRAVNDTEDSDTIAAIVGAALGALHGADAWPARWRKGLLARIEAEDDGGLFQVLTIAQRLFTPEAGAQPLDATRECKRRTIVITRQRFHAGGADHGTAGARPEQLAGLVAPTSGTPDRQEGDRVAASSDRELRRSLRNR